MNTDSISACNLLKNQPLTIIDAARLVLEAEEELCSLGAITDRESMIRLLRRVIRAGIATVQAETNTVSFKEAAWASVEARRGRREATKSDLRHFLRRMLRVDGVAERPLRAMSTQECRELLEKAFGNSVHSYRKGRAILHSIFSFGYRREWCDVNPVKRIEVPPVTEKEIVPLTSQEIRRLESVANEPDYSELQLPLHLMLYCGIRPSEVERLNPQRDIDWRERTVTVRPITSKTGGGRIIPLRCISPGKAQLWKSVAKLKFSPELWRRFRRRAGFHHWVPDVLRHTFATYHAVYFRNLPLLQIEMGHRDATLLRTRYVNACCVTKKAARAFWGAWREVRSG